LFTPCDTCVGQFQRNPEDDYQTYGRVEEEAYGDANF